MSRKIYKRSLDVITLCRDQSVTHTASINLADWSFIHKCYKAISHMPLAEEAKIYLKNHLFSNTTFDLLEIKKPRILVFRFPSGEVRSFVTTKSGFLLESTEQLLWDNAFPFINSSKDAISFDLPTNLPSISFESSFFFANHSLNFTHFLLDFWSLFARLQSSGLPHECLPSEIPIFERPVSWQREYFGLIHDYRPRFFHDLFEQFHSPAFWFCPSSIIFPLFDNKPLSLLCARNYLQQACINNIHALDIKPPKNTVIFLTRKDARRARIKNISSIEKLILDMGGLLIDPMDYNLQERFQLFSQPNVFVGESSGCMNFAIFSSVGSRLIMLTDPSALESKEFLVGGFKYVQSYASATDYLVGSNYESLPGSPLGTAEYSLSDLKDLIHANFRMLNCDP